MSNVSLVGELKGSSWRAGQYRGEDPARNDATVDVLYRSMNDAERQLRQHIAAIEAERDDARQRLAETTAERDALYEGLSDAVCQMESHNLFMPKLNVLLDPIAPETAPEGGDD